MQVLTAATLRNVDATPIPDGKERLSLIAELKV